MDLPAILQVVEQSCKEFQVSLCSTTITVYNAQMIEYMSLF